MRLDPESSASGSAPPATDGVGEVTNHADHIVSDGDAGVHRIRHQVADRADTTSSGRALLLAIGLPTILPLADFPNELLGW